MIELRPFATLGAADHGWLNARHHFSFAGYHDPARMGWGALRVWNDDVIAAGSGFPPHVHDNMEIITYVRAGAITHHDSLGNTGRTAAGDVQVMSAGTGIRHAEFNADAEECRLFQIWIVPDRRGHAPAWGTKPFPRNAGRGRFTVLAAGPGSDGHDDDPLPINADALVAAARLAAGDTVHYPAAADRWVYLVPASGAVTVAGASGAVTASARDGVAIAGETGITITAIDDADVVLVDTGRAA